MELKRMAESMIISYIFITSTSQFHITHVISSTGVIKQID